MNSLTEVATSKVSSMVIDSNADINAKYAVSYCDDSADDATCSTPSPLPIAAIWIAAE